MKRTQNFWLLGGDLRQEKLAGLLRADGHRVHTYALGESDPDLAQAAEADCVVLPLPVRGADGALNAPMGEGRYPLEEVFARLAPGPFLCGGMVDAQTQALAARHGLTIHDYFRREELAVANAVPTA